ncbi:MAG: dienelactone hydrolase family protein [Thermoproteota archaeon]|nr:dienelactone hydrolase family protein [Thermoproteota archaeon]
MDISSICQYQPIKLTTERGEIDCRYYYDHTQHPTSVAVLYVTGVGGGWGTPAGGLYPKLCGSLVRIGIDGLRVRYRHPTDLSESVFDTLAGIAFLKEEHRIKSIGLVGHSFGGAVIIQAAIATPNIVTAIVTLATQSYGASEAISKLNQRTSKLLIHGNEDKVLPFYCSQQVYSRAHKPKQIVLYEGASHGLDEVSDEVYELVYNWLVKNLRLTQHAP